MKDDSGCAVALGVFASAFWLGLLAGCYLGGSDERNKWQREAIEHNAASYVCDPATGATEFRWKEETDAEP